MIKLFHRRDLGTKQYNYLNNLLGLMALAVICCFFIPSSFAATNSDAQIPLPDKYAQSGTITFCATFTNPPREFINKEGERAGADVDLAMAMADVLGLKVDWLHVKFASLIPALQAGQCDMIVAELYIKPERQEVIDFLPYATSAKQIVVRKGEAQGINSLADLSGMKVAVPAGTTLARVVKKENARLKQNGKPPIDVLLLPGIRGVFQQLVTGMADAAVVTTTSAGYYIRKTNGKLVHAGEPFNKIKNGFGFREDADALRKAFGKALNRLMQSGRYQKIFKKYSLGTDILDK